ncbi:MAG: hypothetical protein WC230_06390, partial [Bacteroidales bacterium]
MKNKNILQNKQGRITLLLVATMALFAGCGQKNTTKALSVRMAESEMIRIPVPTNLDSNKGRLKWNYTHGL